MLILKKLKKISNFKKTGRVRICLETIYKQALKNKVLIDIGSSFGWLEYELQNKGLKTIIGVEPNEKTLILAKKNSPETLFLKGNAANIPVKNDMCDIAVLFDVIEHVPANSEKKVLKEIKRILRKNGILLLSTPFNHWINNFLDPAWYFGHRHYSVESISKLIEKSGFVIKNIEVKGGIWALFYMIWFYINKWIFLGKINDFKWIEKKYDESYNGRGIHTLFITAFRR